MINDDERTAESFLNFSGVRMEKKLHLIRVNRMYNKLNASSIICTPVVETPLCFRHFLLFPKCATARLPLKS